MTPLVIRIPGRPPTPNVSVRYGHWAQRSKAAKQWRHDAHMYGIGAQPRDVAWEPLTHCRLAVEFIVPDRRRRDLDSLISSIKPCLDGFTDAGVWRDDSTDVIVEQTYSVRYSKGETATVYRIEPA